MLKVCSSNLWPDTYPINPCQLPIEKQDLKTIKVSRNDGSSVRHRSQIFIDCVAEKIREYQMIPVLNIYATTNPMNTKMLAHKVFTQGDRDRGNIKHLYVFQQEREGPRSYEKKGHKLF